MGYVKHIKSDAIYGELITNELFCQHKWVSFNKVAKEGIARGDIGQFQHFPKDVKNISDYIAITKEEYEELNYADYNKI